MDTILNWIMDNKHWLFDGLGVMILGGLAGVVFKKWNNGASQTIRSGKGSRNIQAGGDINIGNKNKL